MADNVAITAGSGTNIATDDVGGAHYQRIKLDVGADGAASAVVGALPVTLASLPALAAGTNNIGDVDVLSLPALVAGTANIGDVDIASIAAGDNNIGNVDIVSLPALVAGTANIGDVDVLTLPALPAGTNNIGDVDVLSLPALPAGTNNIGDVDVLTLPALVAGTANIGDVDVLTVPADPFGANADAIVAAGAVGSISAKLRRATQGLEDLKSLIVLAAGTNAIGKLAANSGVDIGDVDITSIAAGANTIGAVNQATGTAYTGLSSFANRFTSAQTSANLVAGTASQRIYVSHLTIATGGTTAGRVSIYWGTGAFTAGTSVTLFDGEFVPSATAAPGAVLAFPIPPGGASAAADNLRITTSTAITVYVTLHYWKV